VPRTDFVTAPKLDRLMIPGISPDSAGDVQTFAQERGLELETPHLMFAATKARYPFDAVLTDIAERESKVVTHSTSIRIKYPIEHLTLEGKNFPTFLLVRVLALGLLGVVLAVGISKDVTALRRKETPNTKKESGTVSRVS
jgi:hypothetical protein